MASSFVAYSVFKVRLIHLYSSRYVVIWQGVEYGLTGISMDYQNNDTRNISLILTYTRFFIHFRHGCILGYNGIWLYGIYVDLMALQELTTTLYKLTGSYRAKLKYHKLTTTI